MFQAMVMPIYVDRNLVCLQNQNGPDINLLYYHKIVIYIPVVYIRVYL